MKFALYCRTLFFFDFVRLSYGTLGTLCTWFFWQVLIKITQKNWFLISWHALFQYLLEKNFERKFFGFLWLPKCISDYNLILLKKCTPTQQQLHCWDNKQFMRSLLNICNLFHFNAKSEFIVWTGDCKKKLSNQNNFLLKVKIPSSYFFAEIIFFCKGPVDYFLNQMSHITLHSGKNTSRNNLFLAIYNFKPQGKILSYNRNIIFLVN